MAKKKKKKTKVVEYAKLEHKVAALWTRVSTERQENENCSLENQKKICKEFAKHEGITIKREFGGKHESAKNEGKMYKEMIAEVAKDREINIILVYSFDRFSRAGEEAIFTKEYLKAKGIYVVSATQLTDPDSASGKFMEGIIFLFNQFENELRRDKAVMGMTQCIKRGEWYGKPPLGYDHKKVGKTHVHTVNDTGRKLSNAWKWKANEGASDMEIVRRLRALGVNVDRKHLNKILLNKFYCGWIVNSLLDYEPVRGKQEILIDEDTWDRANGLSRAGYEQKEVTENYPLKRYVKCADCGGYLTGYTVKAKGKDYYKCNTKGCKCNRSSIIMHDLYKELLNTYQIPTEFVPILSKVLHKVFDDFNCNKSTMRRDLKKRQSEIKNKIEKVQVRYGLGEITDSVYQTTYRKLNKDLAEIEGGLEDAKKNLSNLKKFIDEAIAMSCKLGTLWEQGDFLSRQKLQNLLFPNGIYFDKNTDNYRTETENEVFKTFRLFSASCEIGKEKATSEFLRLSPNVGMRRLERPTPTSRT
ncbi:MAG: recombinase family protein [Prevotella sp.]|nr:recombinase family protein [Prevotella sp.]MBR6263703.1 recombinase family protein [Prevotella sp.]